MEYGLK